jgi:hypothetical protein
MEGEQIASVLLHVLCRPGAAGNLAFARHPVRGGGLMNAPLAIGAPIVVFGFGSVLLSYYHYAVQRGWPAGRIFSSSNSCMVLAPVLIGFSLFITIWHMGWPYLASTVVGGLVFSFVFVNIFRMWSQTALILGPLAAVVSIFFMHA